MTAAEEIQKIVHCAVQGVSNHPEEVQTQVINLDDTSLCIVIRCRNRGPKDTDLGLIIGKQGKNIRALRALIESVGAKYKVRTTLVVKDSS